MPRRRPEPLSAKDKQEIAMRRAKARAWARRLLKGHEEHAVLIAAARSDPDNPQRNDQLRRLRLTHEVRQELVARQLRRERGRPKSEKTKRQVTLRPAHS
jgi:hypothetical protein